MQYVAGRRALALLAALVFATAGSAAAQETTEVGRAAIDTTQPAGGAIDTLVLGAGILPACNRSVFIKGVEKKGLICSSIRVN